MYNCCREYGVDRGDWLHLLGGLLVNAWWFEEPTSHICIIAPVYTNNLCDFDC